jgi:adenylate kinase family enzyme
LHPVKIFFTGPPASGKTYYSDMLAYYYNIPRVQVKDLTDKAFEMGRIEESEDELVNEIKGKIEELRDEMVA